MGCCDKVWVSTVLSISVRDERGIEGRNGQYFRGSLRRLHGPFVRRLLIIEGRTERGVLELPTCGKLYL